MTLLDLLTYRGTLIVLNAIALLVALAVASLSAASPGETNVYGLVIPLAAPLLGLLAFATPRRRKPLLLAAIVANVLVALLIFPFALFGAMRGMPFGWFTAISLQCFCIPVLTVAAAWLGWPRAARA